MVTSIRKKRFVSVVAICAILFATGISSAYWSGPYRSPYGLMNIYYDLDGSNDTSEFLWAYYLASQGVADYAWFYSYLGMGLDWLPYVGNYRASYVPNVFIDDFGAGWLGASDGLSIWLNSYTSYMPTVDTSNWLTNLATQAWYMGSVITHEMSHVFYHRIVGGFGSNYWGNMLTEAIAHYVGNSVWPRQNPYSAAPTNWADIGANTSYYWQWNSAGWANIGTWSNIATTYNYTNAFGWDDRLHLWAFGYFLANYYDLSTGYTGLAGSGGYSPLSPYGWGGSWNIAVTLWLMGTYGYSAQSAIAVVYSPSGRSYTSDLYTMSSTLGDNTFNSKYYWYWWVLAYYS